MSETLLNEIRAAKPEAPSALRERRSSSAAVPSISAIQRPSKVV